MRGMISRPGHFRGGLEIDGRSHADVVIMRVKESARGAPTIGAQHLEEIKVSIEPARGIQSLCRPGKLDPVNVDAPVLPWAGSTCEFAFVDQLTDEGKPAQFRHQRRIKRDLVNARQDLVLSLWNLFALDWIDLDQQQILGLRCANQRIKSRVAYITSIPIGLGADFDRAKKVRQTSRRNDHLRRHFRSPEYVQFSGPYICRRDEELQAIERPHRFEIDKASDQILQRVDIERIEIVG